MNPESSHYSGEELDVFAHAAQWKTYWSSQIHRWVNGAVLEVGAGIGANTPYLQTPAVRSWHCLEPDESLAAHLRETVAGLPGIAVLPGTTRALEEQSYDTILYIDVLEHIEDDREELAHAARLLRPSGSLVVLSPAHPFLFSAFDAAIGHCRRYTRATLRECAPPQIQLRSLRYLDSVGMLASLANRVLLRKGQPTLGQILLWDRWMVPVSRRLDPLLGYSFGKSILGIWTRLE